LTVIAPIPIGDARSGDVLAAHVCDAAGRVLLPAGAVLTEASLVSLARRDIAELRVSRAALIDPAAAAIRRKEIEQQLQVRFRRAGDGDATGLLRQACLEYLLEKGQ
jgi:hypothetical protein